MSKQPSQFPEPHPQQQPQSPQQPQQVTSSTQSDPPTSSDPKVITLPLPNFSERFTSGSRFGREGIPRPSEFYRRLISFTGDSVFDLDSALDATPLSGAAEEIPIVLEDVIIDITSSIHHYDLVPHTVADAIEWIIADIAILGILAEATWRTQHEEGPVDLKQTYLCHVGQVFSELNLGCISDDDLIGLHTALNVGTRVLNEIFQEEICPSRQHSPKSNLQSSGKEHLPKEGI